MTRRVLLPALLCAACGCTTAKTSSTPRTATEQLLISNAVDQSLSGVDFAPFAGRNVFVDDKYIDSVDKNYVVGSIRHRLMMQGANVAGKKEDSEITIEVRSGAVGTDTTDMFVGVPEITVPGMVTLPEVRLLSRSSQSGTAKLGLVAYETSSGQVLGSGGISLAQSDRNDWYLFGIGPYQNGSLKKEIKEAKEQQSMTTGIAYPEYVTFGQKGYRPATPDELPRIQTAGGEKPAQ